MIHSKEWAGLEDERSKAAGLLMVGGLLEGSLEEVAFRCRVESREPYWKASMVQNCG